MGLFVGVPLAGNNNETFCIYTGAFWVRESDLVWVRRVLDRDKEITNSDITSRTQLVNIIFCQPKLKLELIIH